MVADDFALNRRDMVKVQIIGRGVKDPATIRSMQQVPRHLFVPDKYQQYAYEDGPLLIGEGQTISQPYIVALMTEAAACEPSSVVLDIGTGSGYAAAVLSKIAKEVYSVERIPELAESAKERFRTLGYTNISVKVGDGTLGWAEHAPYDAIIVTAGAPIVPKELLKQLRDGGRLVIPVGDTNLQKLVRYYKIDSDTYQEEILELVKFVPLIGDQGWK